MKLAQKELQKINMYKAPRDKLVCILNCCKVISNLLLNASIASNENPPGADEFLPVLIYVTLKVTLKYIRTLVYLIKNVLCILFWSFVCIKLLYFFLVHILMFRCCLISFRWQYDNLAYNGTNCQYSLC